MYQINELSLTMVKNFELYIMIFAVEWQFAILQHHKLKRRVELKERKRLEILKNQLE